MKISDHYPNVNTQGLWTETLEWLGVHQSHLTGKNSPCPFCGGTDRFRWLDNDRANRRKGQGIWICNQCQERTGNGFEFIKRYRSVSFSEAVEIRKRALEEIGYGGRLGLMAAPDGDAEDGDKAEHYRQQNALEWSRGKPLSMVCQGPVEAYLLQRTGIVPWTPDLRKITYETGSWRGSVLLAQFRSLKGTTLHQTFIQSGRKTGTKYTQGPIPTGGAVELLPIDKRRVLGIAEGIETALSATRLFGIPCWAALDARNFEHWEPPAELTSAVMFADNDWSGKGQDAAERLRARCEAMALPAQVHVPAKAGQDWNDVYQASITEPVWMEVLRRQVQERKPAA